MHKALMNAIRLNKNKQQSRGEKKKKPRKVIAAMEFSTNTPLSCSSSGSTSYIVVGDLINLSTNKAMSKIELLIDTGCQLPLLIPAFLADQLGLGEDTYVRSISGSGIEGSSLEIEVHKINLRLNNISILTHVGVSDTAGRKALIGAEMLTIFNLEIKDGVCRLTLRSTK